ncbi:NepR family anti-sigma factor [Erythrobacter sp. NE805]|uniref:NepR family anti-sigma factor n=1 Tax=Erythrobacter sp. NE805 TaxID=3389875 RepID=UPI00396B202C
MASNSAQGPGGSSGGDGSVPRRAPEWADGLKQLYDSVVEEDLPDTFRDLLDRLDAIPTKRGPAGGQDGSPGVGGQ